MTLIKTHCKQSECKYKRQKNYGSFLEGWIYCVQFLHILTYLYSGNEQDSVEFRIAHEEYRTWQKGGQLVSSAILGMSMGSLFGLVFGYARKSLPSSNILKKTLILAVIMLSSHLWCLDLQRLEDLMDISQTG